MRTVFFTLIMCVLLGVNVSAQLTCINELTTAAIDPWVNTVAIFPEDFLTEVPNGDFEISTNGTDFLRSIELGVGEYILTVRETTTGETCEVDLIVVDQTPPIAICNDLVMVNVAGTPVLTINMIDFGSHDAGRPVVTSLTLNEIATIGPDDPRFNAVTEIEFSQNDVCREFNVLLNVWDLDGNSNVCWSTVQITDPLSFCAFTPGDVPSLSCSDQVVLYVPAEGSLLIQPENFVVNDNSDGNLSLSIEGGLFSRNDLFSSNDIGAFNYTIRNDLNNDECSGTFNVELACEENCTNLVSIESKTVSAGEVFCLQVTGVLEQQIVAFQTGMVWDSQVLTFQTLQNSNLAGLTFNNVKPGELSIVWLDENVSAVDGDIQFEVCFQANVESGVGSPVQFGGILFEITNADLTLAYPQLENAFVCIDTCPESPATCDVMVTLDCENVVADCSADIVTPKIINNSDATDACLDGLVPLMINEISTGESCAPTTIVREWYLDLDQNHIFTASEPFCKQIINVDTLGVFLNPESIRWPIPYGSTELESFIKSCEGLELTSDLSTPALTCEDDVSFVEPEYCETSCGLVGYAFEDIVIEGNCSQKIRRWTIIDWCQYDPVDEAAMTNSDDFIIVSDTRDESCLDCEGSSDTYVTYDNVNQDGFYSYDQVINLESDLNLELISIEGDSEFIITDTGSAQVIEFTASAGGCNILESNENLIWEFTFLDWKSGRTFDVQKTGVNFTLTSKEINPLNIEGEFFVSLNLVSLCGNRINDPNNLLDDFSTIHFIKEVDRAEVADNEIPLFTNPVTGDLSKSVFDFSINGEALTSYSNGTYGIPSSSLLATNNKLSIQDDNNSALNGISTLDLVLLLRFLVDENELEKVAQIAADLDKSGDLSLTRDIVLMSKLILGIESEILGEDYFFIPINESIENINPFNFENSFSSYSFDENDFNSEEGITVDVHKYGDLNSNFATTRNLEPATLAFSNIQLEQGALTEVSFKLSSDQLTEFFGAQAELIFNNATIESVTVEKGLGFEYLVDGNKLRFLIANENELQEFTFSINLTSHANMMAEDIFQLSDSFETEFIDKDYGVSPIILSAEFTSAVEDVDNSAIINVYPNPAHDIVIVEVDESLLGQKMLFFNSLGQLEYNQTISELSTTLDASTLLSSGLKMLRIGEGKVLKLIIE